MDTTLAGQPRRLGARLAQVDTGRGREQLSAAQVPELLRALATETRIASVTASSAIENITVPPSRLERIVAEEPGIARRYRNRNERELAGYRDDVETVLGAADAVVVPSKRPDPLPNAALEAAAAGLPVVAAAHGGLPEIVRDGRTGILVRPSDPAGLASALRALADDPVRAAALGAEAARDVRSRFALPRMLGEVQAVYGDLAGETT